MRFLSSTADPAGPAAPAAQAGAGGPVLSRRGLLGTGAGLLGAAALSGVGVAGASSAEAATGDPVLHLVRRTTYGATPELLAAVRRKGARAWLEQQLTPATIPDPAMAALLRRWPTLSMSPAQVTAKVGRFQWEAMLALCDAHVARACWSRRQLFEVMVDFWSNHLNVTCPSSEVWATRHGYDAQVIRRYALGRFSDLLVASARHPAMLAYLDNASSEKDAPNENYARELLELHTVGVGAGYTEAMVASAARLLTGLSVEDDGSYRYLYDTSKHATGPVRVLGFRDPNRSTYGEPVAVRYLRYLAGHPATARRIAYKLAVRFVSDAPPAALVTALAKVYLRNDTAIRPVLRALFASKAFRASSGDKVKRPFEDLVASVRALGIRPPASGTEGVRQLYWVAGELGQPPLGWYPPDGYPDLAAAWRSAGGTLARWNAHLGLAAGWWPNNLRHPPLQYRLRPAAPRTYGALVDAAAAGLGLPQPTTATREAVCTFLDARPGTGLQAGDEALGWRLPYVHALLLDSPAAALR